MELQRRDFLKSALTAGIGASLLPEIAKADVQNVFNTNILADDVLPTEAQKKWMDLKFGMFIHFGINTYYDVEWSDGTLDHSKINPTKLNTDRWCEVAAAAGMKYLVVITKHHDGFCNFITDHTDYSIKNTPFKKDIIGMVAESCKKYGLKLGLYYSLWDRNQKLHDTDEYAYVEFMKAQLKELLTNYGEIVELWFDGYWKKQQTGWKNVDGSQATNETMYNAWRNEGAYRWQMDHLYQYIKKLQPNCLVMNNSTTAYPGLPLFPVDIRSGEKATEVRPDKKVWEFLGKKQYLPLQIETTMSQKGPKGQFQSGSWFWHEWDKSSASVDQVKGWLKIAEQMQANLLLNCGPSPEGLLRPEDEKVLLSLRKK
jgi:alpha-L-fucosidase